MVVVPCLEGGGLLSAVNRDDGAGLLAPAAKRAIYPARPALTKKGRGSTGSPFHHLPPGGRTMIWKWRCGSRRSALPVVPT